MPEELKQRARDEGGPVAAFIMSTGKWQTPPKGGWGEMNYGAALSKHGLAQQPAASRMSNW
jgi:hypothetical protein